MTEDKKAQTGAQVEPPRTRRAVRVALILSLAVNLLIAGVVVGGIFDGRRPTGPGGFDMSLGPFADAMERGDRAALRDRMRGHLDMHATDRRDRAAATAEFLTALRADPFDPAVIESLFQSERDRAAGIMAEGQEAILERIKTMSPEQRRAFADRLTTRIRQGNARP